jgi:hypothetical protein
MPTTHRRAPAVDAQVLAQQFHVGKQVFGGVVRDVYGGIGSVRHTVPQPRWSNNTIRKTSGSDNLWARTRRRNSFNSVLPSMSRPRCCSGAVDS